MLYRFTGVSKLRPKLYGINADNNDFILQNVSFTVNEGEPFLILGPSASGKSTLLRLFNRLSDPDDGTIEFKGKSLTSYNIIGLRQSVGFIHQIPVMFPGTVRDNLIYAVTRSSSKAAVPQQFEDTCRSLLRYLKLNDTVFLRNAQELSVGEQQRIALARALVKEPEVILLDEPSSSLDPSATARFLETLRNLINDRGLSVIMVTHSVAQAREIGGRGILLIGGTVVDQANIEMLLTDKANPMTKQFLEGNLDT
jgi:putative ABC transport system ATP-binding protein